MGKLLGQTRAALQHSFAWSDWLEQTLGVSWLTAAGHKRLALPRNLSLFQNWLSSRIKTQKKFWFGNEDDSSLSYESLLHNIASSKSPKQLKLTVWTVIKDWIKTSSLKNKSLIFFLQNANFLPELWTQNLSSCIGCKLTEGQVGATKTGPVFYLGPPTSQSCAGVLPKKLGHWFSCQSLWMPSNSCLVSWNSSMEWWQDRCLSFWPDGSGQMAG